MSKRRNYTGFGMLKHRYYTYHGMRFIPNKGIQDEVRIWYFSPMWALNEGEW